ncbi:MAG: M23 family metallopeptidase, partial [Microlunatus sp.]|nr:M23 family metallopeptidase [Microlunatus sp.]
MKKTLIVAALIIALGGAFPFLVALFLAVTIPAAAAAAIQCTNIATPATGDWRPPFQQAYTTTSPFGARTDPITGQRGKGHPGIDLVSLPGPGPVVAASAGTITVGNDPGGYGNHVVIDHGGGITTLYGHLASIETAIRTGGHASTGQVLGVEGSTGYSTGNHLHYEIRVSGALVDPAAFMLEHGAPLNGQPVAPSPPPGAGIPDPGKRQG